MYLTRLKLKNYRSFPEVDITFQQGMNVIIGKNSSGKSSILESIDFLLSSYDANIPVDEIIPYEMKNQESVQVIIEGHFQMTRKEKEIMCSVFNNNTHYYESIMNSDMEIIFTKYIIKKTNDFNIAQNVQVKGNGISKYPNLISYVKNSLIPVLQLRNVLNIADISNDNEEHEPEPLNVLLLKASHQSSVLNQYLRNNLYEIKLRNIDDFFKIKNEIKKVYPEVPDMDMDIEYNPKRARVQIYFKMPGSDIKRPLEDEGAGIQEFFYLFMTLYSFPGRVILKDEALTHLHKSLLSDFILAINDLPYQMITTSHIKELIKTLDFGNIIICRKNESRTIAENLMKIEDIEKVLNDLGYPVEAIPEIDTLIQGIKEIV